MELKMAHYAFLDANGIVFEVIVGKDEGEDGIDWEQHYGAFRGQVCKRTSYNTNGGVHSFGGVPFRKNYAGIGYGYDAGRDAFISPRPNESSVLDESSCLWVEKTESTIAPKPNVIVVDELPNEIGDANDADQVELLTRRT
jgi:hypothetical protein